MDFNGIYEADGLNTPPTASVGATEGQNNEANLQASQDEVFIVLNQLKLKIKEFKNNEQIKDMIDRYDGLSKENSTSKSVTESTDTSDEQRLTEATKGTMKSYYKQICNTIDWYIKWVVIGAIVFAVIAIGVGIKINYDSALKTAGISKADGPGLLKWVFNRDVAKTEITSTGNEQAVSKIMSDPALSDIEKKEKLQAMSASNPVAAASVADLDKKIGSTPVATTTSETGTTTVDTTGTGTTSTGTSTTTETTAQTTQAVDLSTWQARVKAGKASDADMEEAYKAYKAGSYTPGPKTMEYFKQKHPEGFTTPTTAPTTPEKTATTEEPVTKEDNPLSNAPDTTETNTVSGTGTTETGASETDKNANNQWNLPPMVTTDVQYRLWRNNPANTKNYNDILAQLEAVPAYHKNPKDEAEYIMYEVYSNAGKDAKTAVRSIQSKHNLPDISGKWRTDANFANSIGKNHNLFLQYESTVKKHVGELSTVPINSFKFTSGSKYIGKYTGTDNKTFNIIGLDMNHKCFAVTDVSAPNAIINIITNNNGKITDVDGKAISNEPSLSSVINLINADALAKQQEMMKSHGPGGKGN